MIPSVMNEKPQTQRPIAFGVVDHHLIQQTYDLPGLIADGEYEQLIVYRVNRCNYCITLIGIPEHEMYAMTRPVPSAIDDYDYEMEVVKQFLFSVARYELSDAAERNLCATWQCYESHIVNGS